MIFDVKIDGETPHFTANNLSFVWRVFSLTVWLYYLKKACLFFPILILILRRMLNLWPLPNGVHAALNLDNS